MTELLSQISGWHWLSAGLLLLIIEALGVGGFFLGTALSALLVGTLVTAFPDIHWHRQLMLFAITAPIFSILYWRYFRKFNEETDQPLLNDRVAQMVGKKLTLNTPISDGQGQAQIGDTFWSLCADSDIAAGIQVEVVGFEGTSLKVAPID